MARKGESITLSLTLEEKAKLEKLAFQFGQMWGDRPNVSALLKEIAAGRIALHHPVDDLPRSKIKRKQAQSEIAKIRQKLDELSKLL